MRAQDHAQARSITAICAACSDNPAFRKLSTNRARGLPGGSIAAQRSYTRRLLGQAEPAKHLG
jgi:hypothetical protein